MEQPYSEVRKRIGLTIGKKFSRWSRRTGCIFGEKGNGSDFEKTGIGNFWNGRLMASTHGGTGGERGAGVPAESGGCGKVGRVRRRSGLQNDTGGLWGGFVGVSATRVAGT